MTIWFCTAAHAADPLRLGLLHTLSPAPFYIAQERGYFRDEGIDLTFRFFEAAQPIAAAAVSGDIDVGVTALTGGFFNLAEKGALKVIGGGLHEQRGYQGSAILVSKEAYAAGLTTPAKLAGHSFAITQYGSSFHYMLGRIAEAEHFDGSSVTLRPVQQIANMVAAVGSGQVDATIAIASMAKPLAASGQVHIIGWAGDIVPYQITAVFTTAHGIQVDYTIGGNPGFTALTFNEGATHKSFTPAQITTDQSGLGTLVSVALVQSIDTGGTRFGFFLPDVQVSLGQSVPVTTIGAIETFSGPNSVPHRPTTWQCVHLHGTAEEVIVALAETAST